MTVRLLTLAGRPAVRQLWQDSISSLDWWPGGVIQDWTLEDIRREIEATDTISLGYFQPAATLRGFFLVRKEGIPALDFTPPMPESYIWHPQSWCLWLWIVQAGFSAAQYKAALDELFDLGWFSRVPGRFCWGRLPRDLIPVRAKTYLDNKFTTRYDYTDREGVIWRYWTHEVAA
ncbi:MAG: hypothetical protein A2V88_08830 [Elusimicrobia bacterium RBG_16_66_12]|nr:MAG: hypothetical protein A2V88_08830 [Elusimicrobia bacterium RBG_16_66_12]